MTSNPVIVDSSHLISGEVRRVLPTVRPPAAAPAPALASSVQVMFLTVDPAGRHPAALGTFLLVAGHLTHLYEDTVETGRQAATAMYNINTTTTTTSCLSPLLVPEHVVGHRDAVVHSGNVPVLSPPRETAGPAELVSSATQTGDREE